MGMYGDDSKKGLDASGDGRTKQCFRSSCDINKMVAQYRKTGMFTNLNRRVPVFADVSECKSYQESLDVVIKAQDMFNSLPVLLRERFQNDPGEMVAFLQDEANLAEAIKLGLVVAPKAPEVDAGGVSTPGGTVPPVSGGDKAPKAS